MSEQNELVLPHHHQPDLTQEQSSSVRCWVPMCNACRSPLNVLQARARATHTLWDATAPGPLSQVGLHGACMGPARVLHGACM